PEHEAAIDALCHHGGLALLVLGLVARSSCNASRCRTTSSTPTGSRRVVLTGRGRLPRLRPEHEAAIDALCHHGGLALLVLGLVARSSCNASR
ncbi:hypothetical protein CTI14_63860, partial [Methylobacterium radiotolerans]